MQASHKHNKYQYHHQLRVTAYWLYVQWIIASEKRAVIAWMLFLLWTEELHQMVQGQSPEAQCAQCTNRQSKNIMLSHQTLHQASKVNSMGPFSRFMFVI